MGKGGGALASSVHPHAQDDTSGCEGGVDKDEPEGVPGREAGLGDTSSEGKGLKPLVGKEGHQEGHEAIPAVLGSHAHTLQEGVNGESKDEHKRLGL